MKLFVLEKGEERISASLNDNEIVNDLIKKGWTVRNDLRDYDVEIDYSEDTSHRKASDTDELKSEEVIKSDTTHTEVIKGSDNVEKVEDLKTEKTKEWVDKFENSVSKKLKKPWE